MRKVLIILYLVLFSSHLINAQQDINSILNYTLAYRGLTRTDITIPIDFYASAEKSPTNDSKLLLPLVRDMMINPLRNLTWLDSVMGLKDSSIQYLINHLCSLIDSNDNLVLDIITGHENKEQYYRDLISTVNSNKSQINKTINVFTKEEKIYLCKNLFSIIEESDDDDNSNFDIFKYNASRDSSIAISKKTMDLLSRLNITKILKNSLYSFYKCYNLFNDLPLFTTVDSDGNDIVVGTEPLLGGISKNYNNDNVKGNFLFYYDKDGIRIAVGDSAKNIYTGHFDIIIDLGGDDIYNISRPQIDKGNFESGFSCILDLSGNDFYTTSSDFALAGGLFSSSFIFDKEGDDIYESKGNGNFGAAIGGIGLIYDEKGNDTYKSVTFSIGAGCFGVGLIVDREGNDFYIANSYSQGFGMTEGVGCIVDNKGNDSYLIDSRSLDIGRYEDHYVSMCQGYGLGLRPYYAGGIGLIIEGAGNDIYNTDIFGQGGAYWYSLGAIVDKSGHDKYNSYQYGQGAGIHLAVGLLKDYDGWDFYQSDGVSQGCGHDFGFGLLWDVKGNDNYSAYSLSQGAGNANGIGMLLDESGIDGYLNKYPGNTRGYGNPRREYGSIGILIDASGEDYYSIPGLDSTIYNSSNWGVMNDYYYKDLPSQVSGNNFKVAVDSVNRPHDAPFSVEQYFIMAKTIEPRFSLWQEYGMRKLIADSINTAGYVLTKLGTDDARETQVMRFLSQKIQKPMADALIAKLDAYLQKKNEMTQPEVSFACYIFGETRNSAGKEILYDLTFDDNYKIRSSAINALGKINYDASDTEFAEKVSKRLSELAMEKSDKKLYNKDIAYALGNYKTMTGFASLQSILNYPYFGVRFLAADNMGKSQYLPNLLLTDSRYPDIPQEEIPLIAFMQALGNLKESDFIAFIGFILINPATENESVVLNLIGAIQNRRDKSADTSFIKWCNDEVKVLQLKVNQRVR